MAQTRNSTVLRIVKTQATPNNFTSPPRGWNSWGMEANPAINPDFSFNQTHVLKQANALLAAIPEQDIQNHDYYISLDSGWSVGDHGDLRGRIIYDSSKFSIPTLANSLHSKGLRLGVYVLPGAFCKDSNKTISGTDIPISATLSGNNNGFARCDFDFEKDGVQQWHNSVVDLFADWGVDLIKLDYITPGSPDNGGNLPPNNSGSVIAYHNAIQQASRTMRLDISWKLERNHTFFHIWESNADSMRTDQDVNNSGSTTFVAWATIQRAIDNYRDFISRVVSTESDQPLAIYPDMDNLYIGNKESITGVSDIQRQTIATHWIGAAANLITGSDLTRLDALGVKLLTDPAGQDVSNFTARYPMQARNPGTGRNDSKQLQAWIAGPDDGGDGRAIVVLANYGPDQGQGGFGTYIQGSQAVKATWEDLGLSGVYEVSDIWAHKRLGTAHKEVEAVLAEGESRLLSLLPMSNGTNIIAGAQ
ncbi:MAG: hypothetical protein M1821_000207 [Bathelium mastoideum]|nr:MAG: hypothetical protein M1821_000207 [Bathelium mastoideum]